MSPRSDAQFEAIRKERKSEILDAALHVFAEEGYHASTVNQISRKAGVSKGLMYNYFESKEAVLRTLLFDLFNYAMKRMKVLPGEEINDERFVEMIRLSIRIPLEEPQRWKLYMSLAFQKDVTEMLMAEMGDLVGPYLQGIKKFFESKGHDDPLAMMRVFSAVLDGVQMHCLLDPEHFPADYAESFLIEQFVKK